MSAFPHDSHRSRLLILMFIPILLCACSTGGGHEPVTGATDNAVVNQDGGTGGAAGILLPEVMGMVMNPNGSPVAYALVGGNEFSTSEGIMSGSPRISPSGWIEVRSMGYLTGYTRSYFAFNGTDFFETYLTPVQFGVFLEQDGQTSMSLTPTEGYNVTLDLSSTIFPGGQVQVFASPIPAIDVESRFTPNPSGLDAVLQTAFGVMAYNNQGEQVTLSAGSLLPMEIAGSGTNEQGFVLARFDPETGGWISDGIECSPGNSGVFSCTSDKLSPLFGIFNQSTAASQSQPANWLSSMPSPLGAILTTQLNFNTAGFISSHQFQSAEEDFKGALGGYKDWLSKHGDNLDPNDPAAREKLDDLIDSARRSAAANPNETGKNHLAEAAAAAAKARLGDIGSQLQSEAADIANNLGQKDLNESDCGEFKRLIKRAEQIYSLGGDSNLAEQLTNKAQDMAKDCDTWIGRIQVYLRVNHSHPAGLDMSSTSGSLWIESHSITMWTNVDDYVMHGEDKINLIFTQVTYKRDTECKQEIQMSGQGGQQTALIEGRYDGYTFQINSFTPETSGISIVQAWDMQKKDDEVCTTILNTRYEFPNYVSVIVHGFEYGSPPLTLQDMLDEGTETSIITPKDSIYGFEEITNPDPDLGKYPFTSGRVDWTFTHRDKKLPIKEE